ncbi:chromate transporter [Lishizhenia tianjinensis]|uniref:Chromate transporter n=1 Tax=Lishizhenia tianjinensis TaxID=477690 RepID=A0A1I7BX20_9FLAO|nr:chromate efflux transporter [Lishizhenia tianjinensis]SFT91732.1 chromate transporter [Lishizhenia tianjinensis]
MSKEKNSVWEVVKVFFKMGLFAFGGPAAHIAMMEDEIIEKRKWMSKQHFLDLVGATNLIPGPNSTEMTMHCGHERAGWKGLFAAGFSFILPAVLVTMLFAYLYTTYGELPDVAPFFYGIKPAILAVIAAAIFKLGKKALKSTELGVLGALVLISSLFGVNEVYALLVAGLLGAFFFYSRNKVSNKEKKQLLPLLLLQTTSISSIATLSTLKVFWIFLKVGAILYGSGYVLFAYLVPELVDTGYMTQQELLDAIAVGQFTPGPVLSTATFIGYQIGGVWGSVAATVGIFLPSFLFVLFLNPLVPKMRQSKFLSYFLDSVNIAAVAIMVGVLVEMGTQTLTEWQAIVITALSFIVTFGFKKINVMWTVIGSSVLGWLLLMI